MSRFRGLSPDSQVPWVDVKRLIICYTHIRRHSTMREMATKFLASGRI